MIKRSKEEVILLLLCGLSIPSILPFGVIRLMQKSWLLATVDMGIVTGMLALMVFVIRTRRIRFASIAVTIFYSVGMLLSVYVKGQPVVYWVYPTMVSAYFILRAGEALLLNSFSLLALIGMLRGQTSLLDLSSLVITLTLINLFSYIFSHSTNLQHSELNRQAKNDFLTGAGNRRAFDRKLSELSKQDQSDNDVCLLIFDLDHFKKINDQFGHATGDQVLVQFCALICSRIRASDCLYRYGGEEFAIIAVGMNVVAAARFAEELRLLTENSHLLPDYPVTVSIGVAHKLPGETAKDWFLRADNMLYAAKLSGRNRVRVAEETDDADALSAAPASF